MDETALLWKMSPDGALTNERWASDKSEKALITVSLTYNVTGTQKRLPWFVGKTQTPRFFTYSVVRIENFPSAGNTMKRLEDGCDF